MSGNIRDIAVRLYASPVSQKAQLTGVVTKATNGEVLAQAMQYDVKGNITSSKSKDIGERIISNTSSYTYTNKLSQSTSTIDVRYGSNMTVSESFGYNAYNNQQSSHTLTVNHGTAANGLVAYVHDNLGRLAAAVRSGSSSIISYAYDLRGWLTNISTSTFTEELFYADSPGTALYNGNISSIRWKDNTQSSKRGYKFSYDSANRLTSGAYGEGDALSSNTNRYSESMSYDANGNITGLTRYGNSTLMDNLTISYTGNQPTSVSESVSDNNISGAMEYKKANGSGYKFNANGSLVADKSRGIAYITYDFNNNPKQIYFTNGSVTKYVYSASGQKLRAVHYTAKPNITRTWGVKPAELTMAQILQADSTDYLLGGKLTMKNGKVDKYLFDGGYAQASATSTTSDNFTFYYYTPDHLGNIREVVDASGTVQQVTNYYPFGATYADAATNADFQPYKYNGKELDKMHGLNTYDYGARQYDPILARWDRIDPLAEKYRGISPYVYCAGNPVNSIDPNGKEVLNKFDLNREQERKATDIFINKVNDQHNSIMLFAHGAGNGNGIVLQDGEYLASAYDLERFLENNSETWKNRFITGDEVSIVLFSCETGGDGKFAQTISMDETFQNIKVIAPADVVTIYEDGTASVDNNKTWVEYINGQKSNNYNGSLTPGTKEFETSSYWERMHNANNNFK